MPSFERADSISQRKRMINEASQAEDFKKVSELAEKTQVELLHGELRGDDSELTMYDEALEMEKEIKRQARLNELREKLNSNDELEKKSNQMKEKIFSDPDFGDPKNKRSIYEGQDYFSLGRADEAKQSWEREAMRLENNKVYFYAGREYEKAGKKEKAEEVYKKFLTETEPELKTADQNSTTIQEYAQCAEIYEKLGDMGKRNEMYEGAIKVAEQLGEDCGGFDIGAMACEKLGYSEKAKEMWTKQAEYAGRFDSPNVVSLVIAGRAYARAGEKDKSAEFYQKAIRYQENLMNHRHVNDYREIMNLSEAYVAIGEKIKAVDLLRREAKRMEDNGAYMAAYEYLEKAKSY